MRAIASLFSLAACLAVFTSSARSAVIMSFGAPQTFNTNTGIQSINLFANSTIGAGESAINIGAKFTLGGVAVFNTPVAGTFGGPGFLGNGNIRFAVSSFDSDPVLFNTGNLTLTFNSAQQFGNAPTPLATLLVDTNGLANGNYSINVTNGFFGLGTIANTSGSFNIQGAAVPEPTSIALLCVAVGGVFGRRYLRKKKVARIEYGDEACR